MDAQTRLNKIQELIDHQIEETERLAAQPKWLPFLYAGILLAGFVVLDRLI